MDIEDDDILEITEFFIATLIETEGLDLRITLNPVEAVVNILDNDGESTCFHVYMVDCVCFVLLHTVAVVGLERTIYMVTETQDEVEICAIVREPISDCPITFPFEVVLSTLDDTAGIYCTLLHIVSLHLIWCENLSYYIQLMVWTTLASMIHSVSQPVPALCAVELKSSRTLQLRKSRHSMQHSLQVWSLMGPSSL